MPAVSDIPLHHPVIESFELLGVNGYKNLILQCNYCIKIVAAENGTGKTTLLNALHAILSLNFSKLTAIDFISFRLKLKNTEEIFVFKDDLLLSDYDQPPSKSQALLNREGVSDSAIRKAVSIINSKGIDFFTSTHQFLRVYYDSKSSREELTAAYKSVATEHLTPNSRTYLIRNIETALQGTQVLYLPTFRRIETEFTDFETKSKQRTYDRFYPLLEDDYEDEQLIWFGMNDVSSKLDVFRSKIKTRTSESYSKISAQSLEALLSPDPKRPDFITSEDAEFLSQISLVLARLGTSGGEVEARTHNLIYSGEINHAKFDSLRAHLFQIVLIYAATQADELAIEGFTQVVNNYWGSAISELGNEPSKKFEFDKFSLSTEVINSYNRKPLKLNNLSSGEKQIVSVFAKLYLRERARFIVLIDEPELSLSMAWQKMFLKDILESPSCDQLIAITHSPFIFDNELDAYAEPLIVTYMDQQQ
jgi:predicted ATP-dependent endonuclease of OLD family